MPSGVCEGAECVSGGRLGQGWGVEICVKGLLSAIQNLRYSFKCKNEVLTFDDIIKVPIKIQINPLAQKQ